MKHEEIMKKINLTQLAIFVIGTCTTLTTMMLIVRLIISLYVFFSKEIYIFGMEDLIYSSKAGLAAGIPLGIGCWILTKIEEHKKK